MILTAGCGISQKSFPHWPTWVKYVGLVHNVNHINIGGPAAGNEFIGESVIDFISKNPVTDVIVTWTDIFKLDFYIEKPEVLKEILNFPTRNWTLDIHGKIQNTVPGWWPSSVTNDNRPKQEFNIFFKNKTQMKNRLLTYIKIIQSICKEKNIRCRMFFSYETHCSLEDFNRYNIDLSFFPTQTILANDFFNGPWAEYLSSKKFGLVPVAGWHWEFYKKYIMNFLDLNHPRNHSIKIKKLEEYALEKTKECYQNHIS